MSENKVIKTKRGYFTIDNGYVTWFFFEAAASSACSAYGNGDIDVLDYLCILKINTADQIFISSRWPHTVRGIPALVAQIRRMRLDAEREKERSNE